MAYEIHWEKRGAYRRFFGHTSDVEIMQSVNEASGDPRVGELHYVINDFTACDDVSYSKEGTELISALGVLSEMRNSDLKIAIVADKSSTSGLVSTYMSVSLNTLPTRVFSTLSDAREWVMT